MKNIEQIKLIAKNSITGFSTCEHRYKKNHPQTNIETTGEKNNLIYCKDNVKAKVKVNFKSSKNCRIYIGNNLTGNLKVNFTNDNSIVYIGDNCNLKNVTIHAWQSNSMVLIGNHVTTAGENKWVCGVRSGNICSAIIIGDDCMFSYNITIRDTDAHPIFKTKTGVQANIPRDIVHIEPHVWICQDVNILKNVTIGACSILGAGSTIAKSIPRFSKAFGNPAKYKVDRESIWSRTYATKTDAEFYFNRYIKE